MPETPLKVYSRTALPAFSETLKSAAMLRVGASSLSSIKTLNTPLGAELELAITALTIFIAVTLNNSTGSSISSSIRLKVTDLLVSPGANVTV